MTSPLTSTQHVKLVFDFIKVIERALNVKTSVVNFDACEDSNKQHEGFQKLCETLKTQPNNRSIVALTTLPADSRDGPQAKGLFKEWIYIPSYDVMFYILSDGRRKVTGDPKKIAELMQKISASK